MNHENGHIPLSAINGEYNINVIASPPHRHTLAVTRSTLDVTLKTLQIGQDKLLLYFLRDEPVVTIPHRGKKAENAIPWEVDVATFPREKLVEVRHDPKTGATHLLVRYQDQETKDPEATAHVLSPRLQKAMASVPGEKYRHNDSFKVIPLGEFTPLMQYMLFGTPVWGTLQFVARFMAPEFAAEYAQQLAIFLGIVVFSGFVTYDAVSLALYRSGRTTEQLKNVSKGSYLQVIDENPLRMVYPVDYVHRVLGPGFLYHLSALSRRPLLTTLGRE